MTSDKTFEQKKSGVRLTLRLSGDRLTYTWRDHSGEREFSVNYEAINILDPSKLIANNVRARQWAYAACALLLVACSFGIANGHVGFQLVLSAVITLIAIAFDSLLRWRAVEYTLLYMSPMPPGAGNHPIRIIRDKSHETIFSEIKAGWRSRLRTLHGEINPDNSPERELAKFAWLKQHEIIDEDEYEEAAARLRTNIPTAELEEALERTIH